MRKAKDSSYSMGLLDDSNITSLHPGGTGWRTHLPMQETENLSSILGLERSPGGGNGNPLLFLPGKSHGQPWRVTVHGAAKNWTRLSDWTHIIYTRVGAKLLVCLGTGFRVSSLIITIVPESCPESCPTLTIWPMRFILCIKQTLKKPCRIISGLQVQNWNFNRKRSKEKESIPFPWAGILTFHLTC